MITVSFNQEVNNLNVGNNQVTNNIIKWFIHDDVIVLDCPESLSYKDKTKSIQDTYIIPFSMNRVIILLCAKELYNLEDKLNSKLKRDWDLTNYEDLADALRTI